MLPTDKELRKQCPIASGNLHYFPLAAAYIAHVSFIGNEQHNPGEPMHWDREKSSDHIDCIGRHLTEADGPNYDDDNLLHAGKLAWRACANLQLLLEQIEWGKKPGPPDDPEYDLIASVPWTFAGPSDLDLSYDPGLQDDTNVSLWYDVVFPPQATPPETEQEQEWVEPIRKGKFCYIAGPMRGIEEFNFPAFDDARAYLNTHGWKAISPADLDRIEGDDKLTSEEAASLKTQRRMVARDAGVLQCLRPESGDAVFLLPGWERSQGAAAEFFLARWLSLPVYDYETKALLKPESIQWNELWLSVYNWLYSVINIKDQ